MSEFLRSLQQNSGKVHAKSDKMKRVMSRISDESKKGQWSLQCTVSALSNDDKECLLALGLSVVYRSPEQIYVISWRERNRPQFFQPQGAGIPVNIPAKVEAPVSK